MLAERTAWLAESIASTRPPACMPVVPAPTPAPARTPVVPVPTPTPARTPVAPAPTLSPACTPVVPAPTPAPARTPVVPAPTPAPAHTPVVPVSTPSPARTPAAPTPSAARPPTPPPAPVIPHYLVSRPMANAPKGHPLAAPAAAQVTVPATKRKPGRPRKNPVEPAVEMGMGSVGGMTPEARAESDRIHHEEAQLRETRKEMLRRERAVEGRAAAAKAEGLRLAALVHNLARGAPLTIIKCSSRAMLDPEGNPLIHPVVRTRGDIGNGGRLALRVLGSDVLRAQEDTEMLEKLSGKKAAGTKKTSAANKAVSKGGTKHKASDTIPVGEPAAKKARREGACVRGGSGRGHRAGSAREGGKWAQQQGGKRATGKGTGKGAAGSGKRGGKREAGSGKREAGREAE
ncbi:hypothetical protein B0H14DRAFT_3463127 [Mycena olivaceomarginata]|nr:hypothetical protein B0H14DRAFT_3463127 [Mycena olivaceomarginata]